MDQWACVRRLCACRREVRETGRKEVLQVLRGSGVAPAAYRGSNPGPQVKNALLAAHLNNYGIACNFDATNPDSSGGAWQFVLFADFKGARVDDREPAIAGA